MKRSVFKPFLVTSILFSLYTMDANSQQPVKNYTAEWIKVEALADKGLPQSALTEVKKIYALAKKEKQDAQLIKALVYMITLQTENREDNEFFSIAEVEKEISISRGPAQAILQSLLAELYQNYFQNYRWKLYNRTKTEKFNKADISTWDAEDFHRRIGELYLQSLKDEKTLQQTKLEPYDAIIAKGNVRHLRPSLFDLLAHRALDYFESDERDIKKPAYAFEISQASAFDPAADFVTRRFTTSDSLSLQHKALQLYQQLLRFHLKDAKPDALLDADLRRITFVRNESTHPDKEQLYFNAIHHLANQYGNLPAASQAWYLLGAWYSDLATEYKPYGDTSNRYARLKAKEILEKLQQQKDSSEGKINAFNLLKSINSRSFQFTLEKVNVPGQPFLSSVKYRNVSRLWLRIIRPDEALKKQLENQYDEKYWPAVTAAPALRSWEQVLPATNDLQEHRTEIKIDGLPAGEYLLLASADKDFSGKNSLMGARFFYVSGISYVSNNNDYFVLNRDSGRPLANAAVQVWEQKYNYALSKYVIEKGKRYTTDGNGFFKMEKPERKPNDYTSYSHQLEITHGSDRLFLNELQYDYYYSNQSTAEPKDLTSVHFFTDRSIYRPGQTVYFKGIVLSRSPKEKKASVLNGYSTTVILRDANYKDIDTLRVKTNAYGSFNGRFVLPQSGLNGQFSLYTKTEQATAGFRVEEYKRPKFYVEYEPIKGTYKVNDKIKVTGVAKAYAGNTIDGASVKYRVVRQPRFLYPWMFWRWWQPPADEMEIAHGVIKTDKNGKFTVEFTAIPDLKIEKKFEPAFDYTVYADVTDINGETRSGEKMVSVSYKSLVLSASLPSVIPVDSLRSMTVRTQNMNGEFEPASVLVSFYKLKEEKRLLRDRRWDRPDQFVMGREEYEKNFPHDEYDNESDPKSWATEAKAYSVTDATRPDGKWTITNSGFVPGYYRVEISTRDKNGQEVKDITYTELTDENSGKLGRPDYLWTGKQKIAVEPGEKASVEWGSSAEGLFVVQQLHKGPVNYQFRDLSDEKKTFYFDAGEEDRGGFGVGWLFVKHNRVYQLNQTISVPWTNKDLDISYSSFRDKTEPGSTEKWKLKISGYKKEMVAAELLASMYDASLDQFYPHGWGRPSVWPYYYNPASWNGTVNFNRVESNQKFIYDTDHSYVVKNYDGLFMSSDGSSIGFPGNLFNQNPVLMRLAKPVAEADGVTAGAPPGVVEEKELANDSFARTEQVNKKNGSEPSTGKTGEQGSEVKIRKNFNETAFFFPELRTDSTGSVEFTFTMPEALTKWKFMAIAHTKDAAFGSSTKEIVTQKELMVQPNAPRFLREGDKMEFSSKVVNLTDKEITGTASFQLFDAATNEPVDGWFQNQVPNQYFTVGAGQSEALKFPMQVPYLYNKALVWRIVARSGNYSDGEENMLPVLTNRMLVTETMPLPMRSYGTKDFSFTKLLQSGKSESLRHQALTVEYTSNPAWYAVQALPYLMEYPYECAEQTWNRYYANSLASFIAGSSPKIRQVFEKWKISDTAALLSNLQKNQELKAVLLEETPWMLAATSEATQKKNIALLFDMIRMSEQLGSAYDKLKQMQSSNGGFVWFSGGPDDRYITQYIVTGIGHLGKLQAIAGGQAAKLKSILSTAIPYLDRKIKEDYDDLVKYKTNLKTYTPGYTVIQYLYMRSFFPDYPVAAASSKAYDYFRGRAQQTWLSQSKYMQGMTALALHRTGDSKTPNAILKSLKETSIVNEEMGMYWKNQRNGWFWYEAPIETHALLIEVFQEAGKDTKTVDELRTWLLKNKQTNNWKTTKATAEACYALLIQGTEWLDNAPLVQVKLGTTTIRSAEAGPEAGTGYFKKTIEAAQVQPSMGNINVTVSGNGASSVTWGAVYWQYFEDLDKITPAATPLKLAKKLFVEKNTDRGPVITPVNDGDVLKVGDKIKVRVELRVDRDMEYVHMKDMRASALEPVNILSSYKWQGGLGYYESTKDASTNFFFSYLRKGTYVFEYPLFVTHTGEFSNGITTIQSMYAPEFSSHSEGVRIKVE